MAPENPDWLIRRLMNRRRDEIDDGLGSEAKAAAQDRVDDVLLGLWVTREEADRCKSDSDNGEEREDDAGQLHLQVSERGDEIGVGILRDEEARAQHHRCGGSEYEPPFSFVFHGSP